MIWFCLGTSLGLIAVILLYILPPKIATALVTDTSSEKQRQNDTSPDLSSKDMATRPPEILWYYLDKENNQYGPMSFNALKSAWNCEEIDPCTYVWNENMKEWQPLETLPEALENIQT